MPPGRRIEFWIRRENHMAEPRYSVQAVAGPSGDTCTGTFLGRTTTLTDAFTVVGEAVENDQGSSGKNLLYLIRDEEDESRSWTVIEAIG